MFRQSFILVLILTLTTICLGQNVDSLILAAEKLTKKEKINSYEGLGQIFYNQDFTIKSKEFFEKSLLTSEELNDTIGQMNALKGLLRVAYHKEGDIDGSFMYAGNLEYLAHEYNDISYQAYVLHHYARANREDFDKTYTRYLRALEMYKAKEKKVSISIVYRELGDFLLDTIPTEALKYYQQNLTLVKEIGNQADENLARSNISSALIAMKKYEDARAFCEQNIEIAEESNDQDFLAYNYLLIGVSYEKQDDFPNAIKFAIQGKDICEANDLMEKKQFTYQLLREIYNKQGKYGEAFDYFAKETAIKQKLEQEENARNIAVINAQHELDLRTKELEAVKLSSYYRNLAQTAGLIILGILAMGLYFYNVRRRLKVQLQKEELEKLKVEQMLEQEERDRLKERLDYKERELASSTMFTLQKNKMLSDLKEKIGALKVSGDEKMRKQVNSLDRNIELNMNFDEDWQKFKLHFSEVHPDFFERLHQTNKTLNPNETRFSAYIRMGLTTKEIAQLMAISAGSVQKARHRLKKKLDLDKEVNLIEFISNL